MREGSAGERGRTARVLWFGLGLLLLLGAVIVWPTLSWQPLEADPPPTLRVANDAEQARIVHDWLAQEWRRWNPADRPGFLPHGLWFDRRTALLCPDISPDTCEAFEFSGLWGDAPLVDPGDHGAPAGLAHLLADVLRQPVVLNADPRVPEVTTLEAPTARAFDRHCAENPRSPDRAVRISRAVVEPDTGRAYALLHMRHCDNSGGMKIVRFQRERMTWCVEDDR